jgi:hypothetical protein
MRRLNGLKFSRAQNCERASYLDLRILLLPNEPSKDDHVKAGFQREFSACFNRRLWAMARHESCSRGTLLIAARAIREHSGRPGFGQFVEKKLRPVSEVMK